MGLIKQAKCKNFKIYGWIRSIFFSERERKRERTKPWNPKNLPLIRARWRCRDKGYRLISPFIILPAVHRKNSNFANPFSRAPPVYLCRSLIGLYALIYVILYIL